MPEQSEGAWLNLAFSAVSVSLRREIIEVVRAQPGTSVNDLCNRFPVSRFTIMRHLNQLEEAGILHRERRGNAKHLSIDTENLRKLANGWLRKVGEEIGFKTDGGTQ